MAEMRTTIVAFLCFLWLGSTRATSVLITQEWRRDFGWEVTCHWALDMDDSLQSVSLTRNKQRFFLFRPESLHGQLRKSNTFSLSEALLSVDCAASVEKGIKGRCKLSVQPLAPPESDFTFGCAVSGERPYFKFSEAEETVEAIVPPSDTIMVVTRQESGPSTINCTASGIPAPRILWTVDNHTVPHHFDKPHWNETSKLWQVWSTFTQQTDATNIQCTPEVEKGNKLIKGQSLQYNSTFRITLDGAILILATLTSLLLH